MNNVCSSTACFVSRLRTPYPLDTTTCPSFTITMASPGMSQSFKPELIYWSRLSLTKEGVWAIQDSEKQRLSKQASFLIRNQWLKNKVKVFWIHARNTFKEFC